METNNIKPLEEIYDGSTLCAIILRTTFNEKGIHFFTQPDYSQQLAYMHHPAGKEIQAHVHNPVVRTVEYTQEVLFIKSGKLQVDFFTENQLYLTSRTLSAGDLILLIKGGHGFKVLEELEMIEVKQGPYAGDGDKTRFTPIIP